ncbi:aminopeptidase Ey-like isoform X2 [Crassostrea angulata]|uniref:aminopeptidase Ey-like isoform X2 n=1 Tax=Magallana angulata TaxID=2784310 RepID=UPI0022B13D04|nr:aminopeptidase Ey-like isoform X2 [Crassostrea angulata]
MGKAESFDFSDMAKYNSEAELTPGSGKKGCFISIFVGVLILCLVVCLVIGVGLLVYFAGKGTTCSDVPADTDSSNAGLIDKCKEVIDDGDTSICNACRKTTTTIPSTTPAPTSILQDVRLPRSVLPELYTVELQPNLYDGPPEEFTFNGTVRIRLKCHQPTNNITLHSNQLNLTEEIRVTSADSSHSVHYRSHEFDTKRQFLIIFTNVPLQQGHYYDLDLAFIGPLKDDLHGLYLSSYQRNNKTIYAAVSFLAPSSARKVLPCFDEPAIKAVYDVTLLRKEQMTSIFNTKHLHSEERGNGWIADSFNVTPPVSSYLLAFIICDFDYKENMTSNGIRYRAWARPEAVSQTEYALSVGTRILSYFEDYFGIPFPLPKQDMIAVPDFAAGAMENWGLITYRETAMLYDPQESSESNKQRVAVVVSHELAHQWFGNLVTPSWWDDLWLNEGFASFIEYMGVDHVHPDWKMFDQIVVEDIQDVFNFDGLVTSHPVYVPVYHPDQISEIFDRISYGKGSSIIRMMRFFLGEETFRNGLKRYLKNLAYKAAFHDDLWFALGNQSAIENKNLNVKAIMDTWTLQMNYPVVNMTVMADGDIQITQKRYLRDYHAVDPLTYVSPFNYHWEIPFTYTTKSNTSFDLTDADIHWMHKTDKEVISASVLQSDWILGNVRQYGYYRVTYSDENWNKLINQLNEDHTVIHPTNRAQMINDAWNLAKSGDVSMTIALKTVNYLDKEKEFIPWKASLGELGYVDSMLERTALYGPFSRFMKHKVSGIFTPSALSSSNFTHLESYVNTLIAAEACKYGIESCVSEASRLYKQWMSNPSNNPIRASVRLTVYCSAIRHGGTEEWDFAYRMYKQSNVASEQSRLMLAMSCSSKVWVLGRYLQYSIDPTKIRKQDATNVIVYISENEIGRGLTWDFVRENWERLMREFGSSFFAFTRLISGVTAPFNTNFELKQLEDFVKLHPNMGSGTRAFQQAIEKTLGNINWMDQNYHIVKQWLADQGFLSA